MTEKSLAWYELPAKRWQNNPKTFWENDSQRQKVYDAEMYAKWSSPVLKKEFDTIEDIQKFVNMLLSYTWFKKRFGILAIEVQSKRWSGADAQYEGVKDDIVTGLIRFASTSHSLMVVLHEVAHIVKDGKRWTTQTSRAGSSHGRFFARILLELVESVCGIGATKVLRDCFKQERVKYLPKRVLSDEAREKLRQNFITNVLKQKVGV